MSEHYQSIVKNNWRVDTISSLSRFFTSRGSRKSVNASAESSPSSSIKNLFTSTNNNSPSKERNLLQKSMDNSTYELRDPRTPIKPNFAIPQYKLVVTGLI